MFFFLGQSYGRSFAPKAIHGVEASNFKFPPNTLTLFFIPSPLPILWDSPSQLARSILLNYASRQSRFMAHVAFSLQCKDLGVDETTGMVAAKMNAPELLFKKQIGLDILFYGFPGRLEKTEELWQEFEQRSHSERLSFAVFELDLFQCQNIQTYLSNYRDKKVYHYYGLAHDPLHAEGSGCSAFAASILKTAGLMDPTIERAWSKTIFIPSIFRKSLMKQNISFWKLLYSQETFSEMKGRTEKFFFWSPNQMHQWAKSRFSKARPLSMSSFVALQWNHSPGIFFATSKQAITRKKETLPFQWRLPRSQGLLPYDVP